MNTWSLIAEKKPGRTDNEIKNYWRSHMRKKLSASHDSVDSCKVNIKRTREKMQDIAGS